MALNRLGDFLDPIDEKNVNLRFNITDVRGISIRKIFIPTKADMDGVSLTSYKVVKPLEFCYVPITSRNGEKITIAINDSESTYICSSSYIAFRIKDKSKLLPFYLYIYFNRPEFDRYSRFNSWGSAREAFGWENMCDIEIDLPPIEVQQKVVDVYLAMVANQKNYERGLDDLKLACDAYIEALRRNNQIEPIGQHIVLSNEKNTHLEHSLIIGVGTSGLVPPKVEGSENTANYNIVKNNYFIYNPSRINIGSIGLYKGQETMLCSPIYNVFSSIEEILLPEYLMLWFKREEFKRYTTFHSLASVRNNFTLELMSEVQIPIPSIQIQKSIVEVFKTYETRKKINEYLKKKINEICPVLIKGSIYLSK